MLCPVVFKEDCILYADDKTIINVCPQYSECYKKLTIIKYGSKQGGGGEKI